MAVTVNKHFLLELKRAPLVGAFSVLAALAYAPSALALDWQFEPAVGAFSTITDNVNQSENNAENALILGVTPGFTLRSKGSRRVQASIQYGLSGVTRFGGNDDNDLIHNLNATGKAELVEDFLFIDASARISQELISLLGSSADASINSSNRANVGTYLVSPYVKQRFGTFANGQARYTASGAIFGENVASNSASNAFTAGLNSGTRFNDLSWGLNYSIRKADNKNTADTTFEQVSAQLGYALTRKFRVFGTVGQDWNDYLSTTQTDGSSYSVGFGWSPSRRTSIEASVGERYFGSTYSLSANHKTRKSRWNVRYSEDVSDITQQFLEQSSRVFWVCNGIPFESRDGGPPPAQTNCVGPVTAGELALAYNNFGVSAADLVAAGLLNVSSANGVFIIKSLTAGVSWDLGRLGFGLSAQDTKRLYQVLGDAQDHTQGLTGSVSYRMSPKTTASSSLSIVRNSADTAISGGTAAREDDTLSLNVGVNRRFAEQLNGALTFRHTQRDSNAANASYDENSLMATVNMRF